MKQLIHITFVFCAGAIVALTAMGGPEPLPSGKDVKQVVMTQAPPVCEWTGFYVGLHGGGQFGHSETDDSETSRRFGYSESGFIGGGQVGYNFQMGWLVIGPEFDAGYMDLEGRGGEPGFSTVHAETDSDFYTTFRGRVGLAFNAGGCWLIYGTGGGIGVNYTTRFHVDPDFFDARDNDFNWGYTFGGGVERMVTRHWSIKAEYLYFRLDDQSYGNVGSGVSADFDTHTFGHIIRAGLNYKF